MERSICHIEHEGARVYRGLYVCEKTKKKLNADLNAASNIAHRAGYKAIVDKDRKLQATPDITGFSM